MTYRLRIIILTLITVPTLLLTLSHDANARPLDPPPTRCYEDMRCWCKAHGLPLWWCSTADHPRRPHR